MVDSISFDNFNDLILKNDLNDKIRYKDAFNKAYYVFINELKFEEYTFHNKRIALDDYFHALGMGKPWIGEAPYFKTLHALRDKRLGFRKGVLLLYWLFDKYPEKCEGIASELWGCSLDERLDEKTKAQSKSIVVKTQRKAASSKTTRLKPSAPFVWPTYVTEKNAKSAELQLPDGQGESIWLNPYNHHSIPLEGRDREIEILDKFMQDAESFLVTYIIAPSGAGKTRLISEWMRKYIAKPDDEIDLASKILGWDAGLVETVDHAPWEEWQPECDTLVVIDYTYNYDRVIEAIAKKSTAKNVHKLRLLILDHIKPANFGRDIAFGKAFGSPRRRGISGDFVGAEFATIKMNTVDISTKLLISIIARVASLFSPADSYDVNHKTVVAAFDKLCLMGKTSLHPLFAALMGQVIGINPKADFVKLNRRDLIDQYFIPAHRIPWANSDRNAHWNTLGHWIGAYVSAATLLRGVNFSHLHKNLPQNLGNEFRRSEAVAVITQISQRIVSDEDTQTLKQFEPDILGENFLLLFLHEIQFENELKHSFISMLHNWGSSTEELDNSVSFLGVIQRLVRNLSAEDQNLEAVQEQWTSLQAFLDPNNFPEASLIRRAISMVLIDSVDQLKRSSTSISLIHKFQSKIDHNDLKIAIGIFDDPDTLLTVLHYLEWVHGNDVLVESLNELLTVLDTSIRSRSNESSDALELMMKTGMFGLAAYFHAEFDRDLDNPNLWGNTPLLNASNNNRADAVRFLIGIGADVNGQTEDWAMTPLTIASINGYKEVVEELILGGANVSQGVDVGFTALILASFHGHIDVVELLSSSIKNYEPNFTLAELQEALLAASENNHPEVVALLIENGAMIDEPREFDGLTALCAATVDGNSDLIDQLQELGADLNKASLLEGTPLMVACQNDDLYIVQRLLANGAKVSIGLEEEWTALIIAAHEGKENMVHALLRPIGNYSPHFTLSELKLALRKSSGEAIKKMIVTAIDKKQRLMV